MTEHLPEFLYRYTEPEKYKFDKNDYLLPHRKPGPDDPLACWDYTVPMVSEIDWEFVANYFGSWQLEFIKLSIERIKVEKFSSRRHAFLKEREYFGKVHKQAIIKAEICGLEGKKVVVREIYKTPTQS